MRAGDRGDGDSEMKIINISYDGERGVPVIREPASALKNNTGTWRVFRPTIDTDRCVRCGKCWVFCPEGAIHVDDDGDNIRIDYNHCKGCGICGNLCRFITAKREV